MPGSMTWISAPACLYLVRFCRLGLLSMIQTVVSVTFRASLIAALRAACATPFSVSGWVWLSSGVSARVLAMSS